MGLAELTSLLMIVLIFGLTPGPGTLAVLASSLSIGFKPAFYLSIGLTLGDVLWLLVVVFSLGLLSEAFVSFIYIVRILGAVYIIYLGYQQIVAGRIELSVVKTDSFKITQQISKGFLIGGTNPKVMIFYISILPNIVDFSKISILHTMMITAVIAFGALVGLNVINLLGRQIQKMISTPVGIKRINYTSGLAMAIVGIAMIFW